MDILEKEIQKILSEWNPLGGDKLKIKDLDDYKIEAMDISSNLYILNIFSEKSCIRLVQDTISQAFDINAPTEEAEKYGKIIWKIFSKNKKIRK